MNYISCVCINTYCLICKIAFGVTAGEWLAIDKLKSLALHVV